MSIYRTISFHTLGCKLNYAESSSLLRQFEERGYVSVPFDTGADVCVINTCSVTEFADRKCRQIVRKAKRLAPESEVIVIGCYAQLKPKEIADIDGVSLVLGAAEKFNLIRHVESLYAHDRPAAAEPVDVSQANTFVSAYSFGSRTRTFLKVQDGCSYNCSFCTIPLARGSSRSNTVEQVIQDAREIAKKGVQEIVLTGVNLGDFGNGTEVIEGVRPKKEALFFDLIYALDTAGTGIERYRISSIEPNLCTDEIIDFVAASRHFVPHFHMPLQSGNDKQLRQMRRRYKCDLYAERVARIKSVMPHACIGVDVIVGFPGETNADFAETCRFIADLEVSYLHVFTYSERTHTLAADMPNRVPMHIRRQRNEVLRNLSNKKQRQFYQQHIGEVRPVLFESEKQNGWVTGFTDNYIKVQVSGTEPLNGLTRNVQLTNLVDGGPLIAQGALINEEVAKV